MTTNAGTAVKGPVWRESSSLIICAKGLEKLNNYDYRILIIKRSDKTALFKNHGFFPGGIYDAFDESIEWLKYFEEFGVTHQSLRELIVINGESERPKIFAPQGTGCYDRFFKCDKIWAREISLRINAIRETFEEVGIFLCRTRDQLQLNGTEGICKLEYDVAKWKKLVHNDPREFLNMCKEMKVVPDLWGLHEWCCWATPAIIKRGFHTAFFITFLNEVPKVLCEDMEVKECFWLPPPVYLQMVREEKLNFLPPQIYELSRLSSHTSYDYLQQFSWERRKKGITMYLPISYLCTDGIISVFPGDDFYTGDASQTTDTRYMDCTKTEFRNRSKWLNRVEDYGTPHLSVYCNVKPFNGHLMHLSANGNVTNKL